MPDIFLSYNRDDQATARRFAEAFEREGFKVWWDTTLRAGEAYDQVTEKALKEAKAVVVLWSKRSVESRWVRAEATVGDRNKTLVPVMIESCDRPIMFELTQTADLSQWKGGLQDKAWLAFLADVGRMVKKTSEPQVQGSAAVAHSLPPAKLSEAGGGPSLAILPFTNRSGQAEDEIFAEGMVEDLISALSQCVVVRVLGSSATAALRKGAITDLAAVGRQLGVRYLLEGNVRRVSASLRVTAQLLEAETGAVLWTARFDRPLAELAALQEELVLDVAAHLGAQVSSIELERVLKKPGDLTAWEASWRSIGALQYRVDGESIRVAIEEAARSVAIAPDYAMGHATLAATFAMMYLFASPDDPAEVKRIRAIIDRAVALGATDAWVQVNISWALSMIGFPQEALHYSTQAVRKAPGYNWAHFFHGVAYCLLNRTDEAVASFETVMRLMPGQAWLAIVKVWQGYALIRAGRWTEAEAIFDESVAINPSLAIGWQPKVVMLWRRGEAQGARDLFGRLRVQGVWQAHTKIFFGRVFANSPNLAEIEAAIRMLESDAGV